LNAHTFELVLQFGQRAGEADVDQQARFGIREDVIVG